MHRALAAAGMLFLVASTAHAQPEHVRVVVNGGAQMAPGSFGQRFDLTRNVEAAPVTTDLSLATSGVFEAGARVRLNRRLSIGAVGFIAAGKASGTLEAQLPHPFYFNQPREVTGDLSGLTRRERGVHLELVVPLRLTRRDELLLIGGPSYFDVEQDLVTDLTYSDSYPYDTATLVNTARTTATKAGAGFHAGLELTRQVSRSARVALLGRYTRASLTLSAAEGNAADLRAGGIQVGAGLRVAF